MIWLTGVTGLLFDFLIPHFKLSHYPPPQVLDSHLPLFQRPIYLPHAHHQPLAISETSYLGSFTKIPSQIYPMRLRISPWLWFSSFLSFGSIVPSRCYVGVVIEHLRRRIYMRNR